MLLSSTAVVLAVVATLAVPILATKDNKLRTLRGAMPVTAMLGVEQVPQLVLIAPV
ncbi:hypothetical protein [Bombilactobacillus apium]|uniref:hypothetical protein n=1 Tax=Bombilactobacillus apium TaxID=2675299 RepID=UPI001E3E5743|nr:hypothetical protein [Bombilactobacillus apium]